MEADQVGVTAAVAGLVGALPIAGKLVIDFFKARAANKAQEHEGELKADQFAIEAYREMFAHQLARMESMEAKLDLVIAAEADCRVKVAKLESEAHAAMQLARSVGHRVNNVENQIVLSEVARKIESVSMETKPPDAAEEK